MIAILYYRAHHVAGNTAFVEALCQAVEAKGGRALPVFCASLRSAEPELLSTLGQADALVVTVLAAPAPGTVGSPTATACPRSTPPPRSPSRSSTAG
jgi:cobaltochelatase CobN